MKKTILIITICFATFVSSCKHFTISDSNSLTKGMTPEYVESVVAKGPYHTMTMPKGNSFIQVFKIYIGDYKSDYLAVYQDGKLKYWGFPYEFLRHQDSQLNEIGAWAVEEIKKL